MIEQGEGTLLMVSSMAGVYGFPGEAVYCATKFAQVGFAQGLDKELRPHGIKVGDDLPRRREDRVALGKGRTEAGVANPTCWKPRTSRPRCSSPARSRKGSRIIQVQMRTMAEALA